jgi:dolichol-phosphate mannosyltransferase
LIKVLQKHFKKKFKTVIFVIKTFRKILQITNTSKTKISIIIPCYNNESNIPPLFSELQNLADNNLQYAFEFIFIDDGSIDDSFSILKKEVDSRSGFTAKIIALLKNTGSYNALLAGMHYTTGDCIVHLHADLQDPPDLIPELIKEWEKGYQLVIAYREKRDDGILQDFLSKLFHKLIKKYVLKNAPEGGFDLMLFDNEIKTRIIELNEKNIHLVYLFIWLNYPYKQIPYERKKRLIGKSSYTFGKRIKLAFDTFIGFSSIPVRLIWQSGIIIMLVSFSALIFLLLSEGASHSYVFYCLILFVGGLLQTSIGVLGEFLWRILEQSRNRPNYFVQKVYEKL